MTTIKVDFDSLMGFGKVYRTLSESMDYRGATLYGFDAGNLQSVVGRYDLDIRTSNSHFVGQSLPVIAADAQARNGRVANYLMSCSSDLFRHAGQTNVSDDHFNWAGDAFAALKTGLTLRHLGEAWQIGRPIERAILSLGGSWDEAAKIGLRVADKSPVSKALEKFGWFLSAIEIYSSAEEHGLWDARTLIEIVDTAGGFLAGKVVPIIGPVAWDLAFNGTGTLVRMADDRFDFSGAFVNSVVAREGKVDTYDGWNGIFRWGADGVLNTRDYLFGDTDGAFIDAVVAREGKVDTYDGWNGMLRWGADGVLNSRDAIFDGAGGSPWGINDLWTDPVNLGTGNWPGIFNPTPAVWNFALPLAVEAGRIARDVVRDAVEQSGPTNTTPVDGPQSNGDVEVPKQEGPAPLAAPLREVTPHRTDAEIEVLYNEWATGRFAAGGESHYQCTGWANFRWQELDYQGGDISGNGGAMAGNAGVTSTSPSLHAMASYGTGIAPDYGHVMIVEEIATDGSWIRVSEMNTGDTDWETGHPWEYTDERKIHRQPDGTFQNGAGKMIRFAEFPS